MKTSVEIQYAFRNVTNDEIERKVMNHLMDQGIKLNDVDQLNIYYKLEENAIYYVAELKNNEIVGTGNTPLYIYG